MLSKFSTKLKTKNSYKNKTPDESIVNSDDAVLSSILSDMKKEQIEFEQISINVFENYKKIKPTISASDMEIFEILADSKLKKEIESRIKQAKQQKVLSWDKVKMKIYNTQ